MEPAGVAARMTTDVSLTAVPSCSSTSPGTYRGPITSSPSPGQRSR
jgi:hypothetical protein